MMGNKTWPGWENIRLLGRGTYGDVYEIQKQEFDKVYKCALKIISIPKSPEELEEVLEEGIPESEIGKYYQSMVGQLTDELAVMSELKGYTNIVSYQDHMILPHEQAPGWDILIRMELLTPLKVWLKNHSLSERIVVKIGMDICRALEICHSRQILHRDIKLANIFVNQSGDFKLGDFGIAKSLSEEGSSHTFAGTLTTMAPEVAKGQPYGFTSDLYSLGMVLYMLLNANRIPFMPSGSVTAGDRNRANERRLKGERILSPLNGSESLKKIILKALEADPGMRYQSAGEFRAALRKYLTAQERQVQKRPVVSGSDQVACQEIRKQNKSDMASIPEPVTIDLEKNSEKRGIVSYPEEKKTKRKSYTGKILLLFIAALVGAGGYAGWRMLNTPLDSTETIAEGEAIAAAVTEEEVSEENTLELVSSEEAIAAAVAEEEVSEENASEMDSSEETPAVKEDEAAALEETVVHIVSFSSEVPDMIQYYVDQHPECGIKPEYNILNLNGGYKEYISLLNTALEEETCDLFCVEADYAEKYTKGEFAKYAATYQELGIQDQMIEDAQLCEYILEGGKNNEGEIVGLGYQSVVGAMIYRRSIALEVFGTDDPQEIGAIFGGGSGSWDQFLEASRILHDAGYVTVSGVWDLWRPIAGSAEQGWITEDEVLVLDSKREAFLDLWKAISEGGFTHHSEVWSEDWFDDMKGNSNCFSFFGPAWLIRYVMEANCESETMGSSYGDWAVCEAPVSFQWGGSWVLGSKASEVKPAVGELLSWITVDTTKEGFQYKWASDDSDFPGKDAVASAVIMETADGTLDFTGGQDIYKILSDAGRRDVRDCRSEYDSEISELWLQVSEQYAQGQCSREEAIEQFRALAMENLGLSLQ